MRGIYEWSSGHPRNLNNSNIDGLALHTYWSQIEPQQGVFNWTRLDSHVSAAVAAGKHFSLTIAAGVHTPQWVYGLGADSVRLRQGTVPIPWDPTYLQYFKGMIAQLGAHYANNSALDGVHVTGVNYTTNETFLVIDTADCGTWMQAGYSTTRVVSAFSQILNEFTDDFPGVQLASAIIRGGFCLNSNTIDKTMDSILLALGGWVPQNDGWKSNWIMEGMTGDQTGHVLGSSLPAALNIAKAQRDTRYLELYQEDVSNPTLASSIASARAVLLSR